MKKRNYITVLLLVIFSILSIKINTKDIKYSENIIKERKAERKDEKQILENNVKLSIKPKPIIDIVVSKSKTQANVSNFKDELTKELKNLNIDTEYVNIMEADMNVVESKDNFGWEEDLSSSIGNIQITENGQDVTMIGNKSTEGKNAIWIVPNEYQEQKITFHYDIKFGDSFKATGIFLRVKEEGNNKLTGYALSFNEPNHDYYSTSGSNGAIWKFTYTRNDHFTPLTKSLVKSLNINTTGDLEVSVSDTKIRVMGGGMSSPAEIDIPISDKTIGNGYGFFSEHYSHDCDDTGSCTLTDINVQTENVKTYNEMLAENKWRDEAYKFLINVDDNENEELKDESKYAEILSRLLDDTIYFVPCGVSLNKEQFEGLIKDNDNHGKFITNTDENMYQEVAKYIQENIDKELETQYVICGKTLDIQVAPEGILTGTNDVDWPYGKWRIKHDYEYFENNIGQYNYDGNYLSDFACAFNKVGKYEITFRDEIIQPNDIYVHRRPVAIISETIVDQNLTLDGSQSYDLDYQSHTNYGIQEYEWKYKVVGEDTDWHDGQLKQLEHGKHYIIQLRVKDEQGAWSLPDVRYISIDDDSIPVAEFDIMAHPLTVYTNDAKYHDSSYSPDGSAINNWIWKITNERGESVYTGINPLTDLSQLGGAGTYHVSLVVKNEKGKSSEKFTRTIEVTEDTYEPEVTIEPRECDWQKSVDIKVRFTDAGGSGFKTYKYAISENQSQPGTYGADTPNSTDQITICEGSGKFYLHVTAQDNAGNTSVDRVTGIYKIDNTPPTFNYYIISDDINTDTADVNILPFDEHSGVDKVYFDDEEITEDLDGNYKRSISKYKSEYNVKIVDKVGNEYCEKINVEDMKNENEVTFAYYIENTNNEEYTMIGTQKMYSNDLNINDIPNVEDNFNEYFSKCVNTDKAEYFKYNKEKTEKEINKELNELEDNKVFNIYFDRKEYKLKFNVGKKEITGESEKNQIAVLDSNDSLVWTETEYMPTLKVNNDEAEKNEYEISAKYGEYIKDKYPYIENENEYIFIGWMTDEESKYKGNHKTEYMIDEYKILDENLILDANNTEKVHELYAVWTNTPKYYRYHYMEENLDTDSDEPFIEGHLTKEHNNKYYTELSSKDTVLNKITSENLNTHDDILGYDKMESKVEIRTGDTQQGDNEYDPINVYIYYDRKEYTLVIHNMNDEYIPTEISSEYKDKGIYLDNENKKIKMKYGTKISILDELKENWIKDTKNPFECSNESKEIYMFENWYCSPDKNEKIDYDKFNFVNYENGMINIYANWNTQNA